MYTPRPNATTEERVALTEQMIGELHSVLLGNGQPGKITKIESRIASLEQSRWFIVGATAVVVFLIKVLFHS